MNIGGNEDFDDFAAAGDVEVGASNNAENANKAAGGDEKPVRARSSDGKFQAGENLQDLDVSDANGQTDGVEVEDKTDEENDDSVSEKAREGHMKRLKRERAEARQEARQTRAEIAQLKQAIENLQNGGGQSNIGGGNDKPAAVPAPDPRDQSKYPLGHLDESYIEDKLAWLTAQKAAEQADAVLQRQQETERKNQQQTQQRELMTKVDDLSGRGSEIFDDYHETVIEAGMRGDWKLDQPTFEAAHEAEHGERILYELANDKKEAARVAGLSAYQQLKYVMDRNAEISKTVKPRTKPGAGAPPSNPTRGGNSRVKINPSTDNLDDFEKAWEADAKGKR